jgi:hypothetical protein
MLLGDYNVFNTTAIAYDFIELRQTSALGSLCPMPILLSRSPTMTILFYGPELTEGFCRASCVIEYLINFWSRPDM